MEKRIVNYKGARAYYDIRKDENMFVATLQRYTGDLAQMPPRSVVFIKANGSRPAEDRYAPLQKQRASLLHDISNVLDK